MGFRMTTSRRHVLTAAIGATAAWLGLRRVSGAGMQTGSQSAYGTLAALCAELRCPQRLGEACLRALPVAEASAQQLAQVILAEIRGLGGDCGSVAALRDLARAHSQRDFGQGRMVNVDGWMLSRTEARLYALGMLLAKAERGRIG